MKIKVTKHNMLENYYLKNKEIINQIDINKHNVKTYFNFYLEKIEENYSNGW